MKIPNQRIYIDYYRPLYKIFKNKSQFSIYYIKNKNIAKLITLSKNQTRSTISFLGNLNFGSDLLKSSSL